MYKMFRSNWEDNDCMCLPPRILCHHCESNNSLDALLHYDASFTAECGFVLNYDNAVLSKIHALHVHQDYALLLNRCVECTRAVLL